MFVKPLLLGHRGSPRTHPENSLEGFAYARSRGLDGVELDVHRTLDGQLVVHHDEHLADGRVIAALRKAELPPMLPGLVDVLAWAKSSGAFLNIEIKDEKTTSDGREIETTRLIKDFDLAKQVIVSSFNPLSLWRVKRAEPELQTALLFAPDLPTAWLRGGWSAPFLTVSALHPHHSQVSPQMIQMAHRLGWKVNVWTVNELPLAQSLLNMGVDGLIGDDPEVLLACKK